MRRGRIWQGGIGRGWRGVSVVVKCLAGPVVARGVQGVRFGFAQGRLSTAVVLRFAKHNLRSG